VIYLLVVLLFVHSDKFRKISLGALLFYSFYSAC